MPVVKWDFLHFDRYQFFLQCKSDILSGALPCPDDAMAIELAALALQCKLLISSCQKTY